MQKLCHGQLCQRCHEQSLDQLKATHPDTMDRSITLRTGRAIRFEEGKDTVQLSRDD